MKEEIKRIREENKKMKKEIEILQNDITELKFVCFGLIYDTQKIEEELNDKSNRNTCTVGNSILFDRYNDCIRNNKSNI